LDKKPAFSPAKLGGADRTDARSAAGGLGCVGEEGDDEGLSEAERQKRIEAARDK
jgi:hypothetical protein